MINPLLLSLIKENLGGIIALIFVSAIFGAWYLSKWKSKLDDLEPARTGFPALSEKVDHMAVQLNDIWKKLMGSPNEVLNSNSLINLNPLGQKISEKIGVKTIAASHIQKLKEHRANMDEPSAYELQTESMDFAINHLISLLSKEEKVLLENEAFEQGLDIISILQVIGVELRNIWLKDVGMNISQVDDKS